MNISFQFCPECTAKFRALRFNPAAQQASNQIPFNSIIWRDEYPPLGQMPSSEDHPICLDSLIRLFSARKILWRSGRVPGELKELWQEAQATIPNWPGFQRLELTREDQSALDYCEEETDGMIEILRRRAAIFEVTDKSGGVSSFTAHPPPAGESPRKHL